MSRQLLYVWAPGFYAELERARRPDLAPRPVIVGGDPRKRGLVQAATEDARAAGIREGMPVLEALERCPRARALRTDMPSYREAAKRLRSCLSPVSERIEPEGLGAAYLEVSGDPQALVEIARELTRNIKKKLGISIQVGGAPNRFVAKLAAEEATPGKPRIVTREEVGTFLATLSVDRLPGVGPNTARRLGELGAHRVTDLLRLGRDALEGSLGSHGFAIWAAANGQGSDRIRAARHPRSVSQETTLPQPERDRGVLAEVLEALAEGLARHLELEELRTTRIVLKLRYADGERTTRSRSTDRNLCSSRELFGIAHELLDHTEAGSRPLRLLGLAATRLTSKPRSDRQLTLFPSGE